jgi:hypothetical protein
MNDFLLVIEKITESSILRNGFDMSQNEFLHQMKHYISHLFDQHQVIYHGASDDET